MGDKNDTLGLCSHSFDTFCLDLFITFIIISFDHHINAFVGACLCWLVGGWCVDYVVNIVSHDVYVVIA